MRQSVSGIAVIRREIDGRTRWLAQWNQNWNAFNLVGGHKLANKSFRECVSREVTEELGLSAGDEFLISDDSLAQASYIAWSQSAQEDTLYSMKLYAVEICAGAELKVDSNPSNRWLTETEIRQQRCEDGAPVSPTMQRLLDQTGLAL